MKRIDIRYGGTSYSVGGEELEALQAQIIRGASGTPTWLKVNDGEGVRRDAYLLISPGVDISVIPISDPDDVVVRAPGPATAGNPSPQDSD
ncbi:hypothetical protein BWL13_01295 [Microbacterium oleivorans]|uniref:hypothetical protein n=1 Tax=Microbacterium oleivorans TaxID=273677 RepID=UPI000978CDB2|nr:hypothetical protein [Microbacterium oleivorans]AZS43728.1 hypothetical protein BWL13_01295 [Microbacterium oleivorans]